MDFLQIVDAGTLTPVSVVRVLVELVAVAVVALVLGVGLRLLPERLVPRGKTTRPEKSARAPARPVTTAKPTPSAAPAPTAPVQPTPAVSKAPASAPTPAAAVKAAPQPKSAAVSTAKAEATLDDVLDSFFEDEGLLDEALLDTVAPSTEPAAPAPVKPVTPASPLLPSSPTKPNAAKQPVAAKTAPDAISKEMAAKMTKGFQTKTPAAPVKKESTPAVSEAVPADHAAQQLDDVLDAYLANEQLLDEAILDNAMSEARS